MHALHLALHEDGAWTASCGDDEPDLDAASTAWDAPGIRASVLLWGPASPAALLALAA